MKIIHVYAKNVQMFADAINGTDCKLNASKDINYMLNSLQNFNARDVVGLIVFANPLTKKCVQLVHKFDQLHTFKKMPIVIINDSAVEICSEGIFKVKNSKLFALDSEDNSISDLDMSTVFTTILGYSSSIYDLSSCRGEKKNSINAHAGGAKELQMTEELSGLLNYLNGGNKYAVGTTKEGEKEKPWIVR